MCVCAVAGVDLCALFLSVCVVRCACVCVCVRERERRDGAIVLLLKEQLQVIY